MVDAAVTGARIRRGEAVELKALPLVLLGIGNLVAAVTAGRVVAGGGGRGILESKQKARAHRRRRVDVDQELAAPADVLRGGCRC